MKRLKNSGINIKKMFKRTIVFFVIFLFGFLFPYDIGKYNMYSSKVYELISVNAYKNRENINITNLDHYLFHRKIIDEAHPIIYVDIMDSYLKKFIVKENLDSIIVVFNKPILDNNINNHRTQLYFKHINEK